MYVWLLCREQLETKENQELMDLWVKKVQKDPEDHKDHEDPKDQLYVDIDLIYKIHSPMCVMYIHSVLMYD